MKRTDLRLTLPFVVLLLLIGVFLLPVPAQAQTASPLFPLGVRSPADLFTLYEDEGNLWDVWPQETDDRRWTPGVVTDQGLLPACVGHAWQGLLRSEPRPYEYAMGPDVLYYMAQRYDPWPGSAYDGTNGQGAGDYLKEIGVIETYTVTQQVYDAVRYLVHQGPIVAETAWLSEMFYPKNGVVTARGYIVGYHEWYCYGYQADERMIECSNSWGDGDLWPGSADGRFFISYADMAYLLTKYEGVIYLPQKRLEYPFFILEVGSRATMWAI